MKRGAPSRHPPTSWPSASSVTAASRGEDFRPTTTLALPMTAPVSPPHEGALGVGEGALRAI